MSAAAPGSVSAAEQYKPSVQYSVARVCQDECIRMQSTMSKEAASALGDLVWRYLKGEWLARETCFFFNPN
jgi:hypothetical protein